MTAAASDGDSWWGDVRLAVGEAARWRIGPLSLSVSRGRREWQLAYDWDPDRSESQDWERLDDALGEDPEHQERYVVGETGERIDLRPALADRPVVSLPRVPLHLLPQREVTLFVGSPVWVAVAAGDPTVQLRELPSRRLSDTWFGGSTRHGELCYANLTRACLNPENLPILSRTAVTPVRIRNEAPSPLDLERLKLPVPRLSLFCDPQNRLWTEGVTLTRTEESDMASLDVREGAPAEADGAELLTPPRDATETSSLVRAFSSLLGLGRSEAPE